MIDRDELDAWLRLTAPGVGREGARRLLTAFGSPQAVAGASLAALKGVVGAAVAQVVERPAETHRALVRATLDWLASGTPEVPHQVIALGDAAYPSALLQTADPPLLLYAQGRVELLSAASLAVVGTRHPTPQGLDNARAFSKTLSQAGLTIVSGLALGIDAAAHEGGLNGTGSSVAVVGTGLDRVYPARHRPLAHRIAREGLIVSEYAIGTPPLPPNFPQRNRIIAGLAQGTLVAEAAVQSGSLITARLSVESGRDVFAIPGSIHSPQSRGCHALIKQGAKLVETAEDVLDELLGHAAPSAAKLTAEPALSASQTGLLEAIGHDPVSLDALVARTGWPAAELSAQLLEMELDGRVSRLPGQLFQRRVTG